MSFMDTWSSPSPFPSSPCTPVNYPGEQFSSPVEAVPAPPTSAYDSYNNIFAQLDSCGGGGGGGSIASYDCSQGSPTTPAGLGSSDPTIMAHIPDLQHEQQNPYPTSKGLSEPSFPFFSHKLHHVQAMDINGFADMFASTQSFNF